MRRFHELMLEVPGLLKADIDNAFRRLPIRLLDRWACCVAVYWEQQVWVSQHLACPLGARGS
eukprot:7698766-Karenia_brevis.AAC.1